MRLFLLSIGIILTSKTCLLAAEAGMPQLDPTYWASQAFWLILIFTALYLALSNMFIPKAVWHMLENIARNTINLVSSI